MSKFDEAVKALAEWKPGWWVSLRSSEKPAERYDVADACVMLDGRDKPVYFSTGPATVDEAIAICTALLAYLTEPATTPKPASAAVVEELVAAVKAGFPRRPGNRITEALAAVEAELAASEQIAARPKRTLKGEVDDTPTKDFDDHGRPLPKWRATDGREITAGMTIISQVAGLFAVKPDSIEDIGTSNVIVRIPFCYGNGFTRAIFERHGWTIIDPT